MEKNIRTLIVFYDTEISHKEIPLFRGAILKSLGDKADVLYHNHTRDDTFRHFFLSSQTIMSISMPSMVREWRDVWE